MTPALPRPTEGDVVDLILTDHRLFEDLLRALRDVTSDRRDVVATLAELLVAHGEAEESKVYPSLRMKQAIDAHEVEHGEQEHAEGYQTLLPLLEAADVDSEEFSSSIHEFSETLLHHLDEEERDILNPARTDVTAYDRARLGADWAAERNRLLDEGCGSADQVRRLVRDAEKRSGSLP